MSHGLFKILCRFFSLFNKKERPETNSGRPI